MRTQKNSLAAALLILFLLPVLAWGWEGKVVCVQDGDTITVLRDNKKIRVRLACIDAPEKKQEYGPRARRALQRMLAGKKISATQIDTDRYGRPMCEIYLKGKSINERMIRRGLAWHYKQYCPEREDLSYLEGLARENHKGLWKNSEPIAPWVFHHSGG